MWKSSLYLIQHNHSNSFVSQVNLFFVTMLHLHCNHFYRRRLLAIALLDVNKIISLFHDIKQLLVADWSNKMYQKFMTQAKELYYHVKPTTKKFECIFWGSGVDSIPAPKIKIVKLCSRDEILQYSPTIFK